MNEQEYKMLALKRFDEILGDLLLEEEALNEPIENVEAYLSSAGYTPERLNAFVQRIKADIAKSAENKADE